MNANDLPASALPAVDPWALPERNPIPTAPEWGDSTLYKGLEFVFLDTETTGIDPNTDRIVEIGIVKVTKNGVEEFNQLVNPGFPIPPGAMAVHNITDEMVKDAPTMRDLAARIREFIGDLPIAAHNAKFDRGFVAAEVYGARGPQAESYTKPWLCTYRLARHLLLEAPSYNNMALRYWLKTTPKESEHGAHRAIADVYASMENFRAVCHQAEAQHSIQDMAQLQALSDSTIYSSVMPFGKHKDQEFSAIPTDYFSWALKNMADLDPDMKASMERELESRNALNFDRSASRSGGSQPRGSAQGAAKAAPLEAEAIACSVMPFGKHKDKPISEVPADYLKWLLDTEKGGKPLDPAVKLAAERALRPAEGLESPPTAKPAAPLPKMPEEQRRSGTGSLAGGVWSPGGETEAGVGSSDDPEDPEDVIDTTATPRTGFRLR
jgi:DNA polymerase III epsilon subunit family exonuclease